jgi:hypothetical protein
MSDRSRRRAFLLAILALAGVIGLLAALHQRDQAGTERSGVAREADGAALLTAGSERLERRSDARPGGEQRATPHRANRAAHARVQARRFLAAFLGYQRDALASRTRRALLRSGTPHVIAYLLRAPPRGGEAGAAARVDALHLYGPWRGTMKASALLSYPRSGERSLLEFVLRHKAGGWRVTELYP